MLGPNVSIFRSRGNVLGDHLYFNAGVLIVCGYSVYETFKQHLIVCGESDIIEPAVNNILGKSYGMEFLCPHNISWNDLFLSRRAEASSTFASGSGGRTEYSVCPLPTDTTRDLNRGCPNGSR